MLRMFWNFLERLLILFLRLLKARFYGRDLYLTMSSESDVAALQSHAAGEGLEIKGSMASVEPLLSAVGRVQRVPGLRPEMRKKQAKQGLGSKEHGTREQEA